MLTKLDPFGQERIITLKVDAPVLQKNSTLQQNDGIFDNKHDIRKSMGLNLKVIQKLLAFTHNFRFQINDTNFINAVQVIDLINSIAPNKKIHLLHNTTYPLSKDMLIYSLDLQKQSRTINNYNIESLAVRNESNWQNWENQKFQFLTAVDCQFSVPKQVPNSNTFGFFGAPIN